MKKFTSILCALMMIISVNAVPFRTPKALLFKDRIQQASMMKKMVPNRADVKAAKKTNEKTVPFAAQNVRRARLTTTDVNVSKVGFQFYNEDNDVYYELQSTELNKWFSFDIYVAEGLEDVESGKTYTLDAMYAQYCGWGEIGAEKYSKKFASCSFTKTVAADGAYTIEATATDADGDVWNFNVSVDAYVPQEYNINIVSYDETFYPFLSEVDIEMSDEDEDHVFLFAIELPEGVEELESGKTYTLDDMTSDEYTRGSDYVELEYITYKSVEWTKTVAADGSFTVVAKVLDSKGNTWNLSYEQGAPVVTEQTLTLNGVAEAGSYLSYIEAANEDSTELVSLCVWASSFEGTFTGSDLFAYGSYVLFNDAEYSIDDASFTVSATEEAGKYTVEGTLTCVNEEDATDVVIFTIHLTVEGQEPEPVEPWEMPTTVTSTNMEVTFSSSYWDIQGNVEEGVYLGIRSLSPEIAGTYTGEDLDDYWTYIGADVDGEETFFDLQAANLTVTFVDGVLTVTGTLTVINSGVSYTVTVNVSGTYVAPTEKHYQYDAEVAYNENFKSYDIADNFYEQYGLLTVTASNENNASIAMLIAPIGEEKALTPGSYIFDDSDDPGTVNASSGPNSSGGLTYSFAGYTDEEGYYNTPVWFMVEGTLTIDEDGVITVAARNSYNQEINCVLGEKKGEEGIRNTELTGKTTKRLVNGQLVIEKNGVKFNAIGTIVK